MAGASAGGLPERWVERVLFGSALTSLAAVVAIFGFLGWFSLPLLSRGRLFEVLSWSWQPFQGSYGILPMVVGTVLLALTAMSLAYPLGLGIACFVHGVGPKLTARALLALVRFMTSIPTVVYGFVAVFLLVPTVRAVAPRGTGFSWLAAGLTLALLVVPTVVLVIDAQFQQLEPRHRVLAAALGLSRSEALLHVVLPLSGRGLVTAAVLGFGRAVGDTLVALMVSGNAAQVPASPFESLRSLTAHIALVVTTDSRSRAYDSLFAAGLILLLTSSAVNLTLRSLRAGGTR
jgi:phosphate transport system permease protein